MKCSAGLRDTVRANARAEVEKHPWRWIGAGATAIVLAVSAAFGGLSDASGDAVATVEVGATVDAGPWTITVERAVVVNEFETLVHEVETDRWIAAVVTITNTTDEPRTGSAIGEGLEIRPFAGQREDSLFVVVNSDGSLLRAIQPGLPEQIAFLWEQDRDEPIPASLDLRLYGYVHRRDSLTGELVWRDGVPVATVRVPVANRSETDG